MIRIVHFAIPALILLFTVALSAKLILTPINTGYDTYAWKFSPYRATTSWERGWPYKFMHMNVQDPPMINGVLGPADVYVREFSGWALAGNLAIALAAIALVSLWIFLRTRKVGPWSFSLRMLLAVTLITALACGWWYHERLLWQREQTALVEFRSANFQTTITRDATSPAWLRRLLSRPVLPTNAVTVQWASVWNWPERQVDIFDRVNSVYMRVMPDSHERSQELANLLPTFGCLREVSFPVNASQVDAELLVPVAKCRSVKELKLWYSNVDDAGIAAISDMAWLKVLNLNDCPNVTDGAIDSLLKIRSLETLWLAGTSISDSGLRRLLALPNLKVASMTDGVSQETIEMFRRQGVRQEQPVK